MGGRSRAGVGMDSAHKGSEGPEAGSGTGKAAAASGRPCVLGSVVTELIKSDTCGWEGSVRLLSTTKVYAPETMQRGL
eukprot:1158108-Pelagomonas_calceolata.AAC.10